MYSLPFSNVNKIVYSAKKAGDMPVVKKGTFNLLAVANTYLDMSHSEKE